MVSSWGYVVRDIQITDMTLDQSIMDSMARVVSSKNLLAAEYTDALKYVADHAQGKVIFMDSGAGAAARIVEGIAGLGADGGTGATPAGGR